MTPVEDQQQTSSCVANAVAGAYEYLVKQHRGDDAYDVSRLFIYYVARALDGDEDPTDGPELEDGGSIIGTAIEGLKRYGACSENRWPFSDEAVNEPPSERAFEEAAAFLVEDVALVPTRLEAWKQALAEGHPIIFGLSLYDSFDSHRRPGMVPAPSPKEAARDSHAGHAMLCVGYSDRDQVFIVRNSWGEEWGDRGYCYIPYAYLMNEKYNDGDSWIIRRVEDPSIDESTWASDDESLIGEIDNELAEMSDEDFAELRDAMGSVPFEIRLAVILLYAVASDGEVEDSEIEGIGEVLSKVQTGLGIRLNPERVLRRAMSRIAEDDNLFDDSVEKFADYVPNGVLASIVNAVQEIVDIDTDEEAAILARLVEAWQIQGPSEEEDDDEEEEEVEEEDDEEEEDDDEEEEDDDD